MSSKVYFTPATREEKNKQIAQKVQRLFHKLGMEDKLDKDTFVGLKIHFGEEGNEGHIKPPWLSDLIQLLKGKTDKLFLTDTSTLYRGKRNHAIDHHEIAWRHGFRLEKLGVPVILLDGLIGRENEEIQVDLPRVSSAKIARGFLDTDALVCLSHFTGHVLTGFGAAIKNMGMGCASRAGKMEQHSDVHPWVNQKKCKNCSLCYDICPTEAIVEDNGKALIIERKCIGCGECLVVCKPGAIKLRWDQDNRRVQEKMAEYAHTAQNLFQSRIGYINFLLQVTSDCDCMGDNQKIITEDIGLLASVDPVALDQASVDLIIQKNNKDVLRESNDIDWSVQIKHAEKIGMGTTDYELEELE